MPTCAVPVSEWEIQTQNRKEYLEGRMETHLDRGSDKKPPALQRLLNMKCFDWQENKWGRKGKVIN